jgi:uncharacterized protein YggE
MKAALVFFAAVVAAFASVPIVAAEEPAPRAVRVSAGATVKAAPDRARIAVSVISRGLTAREASETNARASKTVLEKLRDSVKAPGEVKTAGYELTPEYDYNQERSPGRGPKLVGYVATNRFSIVSADLAGIGAVIDDAVAAGASQIDSIGFFLDDEEGARQQALLEAGRKARSEAETVARSLGVGLGQVLEASTATSAAPIPFFGREKMAMAMDAVQSAPTEVVPGALEVTASVNVAFAIP